ncbi:hypothetical protein PAPYR_13396 [Paratrimastix pyriformis]|uniref:Uncharacterized protein n=1 Tax=Paratrimastix pyriformis TaxID=342808 RepID=A0ABQ8U6N3_9EUKA|nr:hypothetical protein PAPYR_13396 [Paratrimastix pyriformis]
MASSKKTLPATKSDRMRKVSRRERNPLMRLPPPQPTPQCSIPAQIEGRIISRVTETPNLAMQPAVSITLVMHPNPSRTRRGVVMVRARTIIKNISGHLPSGNPNRGLACPVRHTRQKAIKIKSGSHLPSANPNRGLAFQARHTRPIELKSGHHLPNGHHTRGMRRILYALGSQIGGVRCTLHALGRPASPIWGARHILRALGRRQSASGQRALSTSSEQAVRASGGQAAVPPPDQRAPMDQFAQGMYRCMELIREFTELWGALHHFPPPPPFPNMSKAIRESKRSPG